MNRNMVTDLLKIENSWEKDGYTYYSLSKKTETETGTENERIIKFDNVYSKWMRALYQLIIHIAYERDKHSVDISNMETTPKYQFFGLAESVANQLMYFLVKDQISGSRDNRELGVLCYNILFPEDNDSFSTYIGLEDLEYTQLIRYLAKLVMYEFNSYTSGQFYDFYISYWSCFEACINQICEPYEEKIRENLNSSQFKTMKKFFSGLYRDWPNHDEIMEQFEKGEELFTQKFGKYVSFSDKYTYLIKNVIGKHYTRDQKADRNVLEFCGALRNTVHNNGTHLKSDKQIEIKGITFCLKKAEKSYSESFSQIFVLAEEVFDIYIAIIDGLDALSNNGHRTASVDTIRSN